MPAPVRGEERDGGSLRSGHPLGFELPESAAIQGTSAGPNEGQPLPVGPAQGSLPPQAVERSADRSGAVSPSSITLDLQGREPSRTARPRVASIAPNSPPV